MSKWNDADDKDIEIDKVRGEVNIYAGCDDWGSIYVTLKFSQVAAMMKAIEDEERQ